jgi:glucose/arabinose dehydrogenase
MTTRLAATLAGAAAVAVAATAAGILFAVSGRSTGPQGHAPTKAPPPGKPSSVIATTVAEGLVHPWSVAFLPDATMLVTEREGRLRLVSPTGAVSAPVTGVPSVVTGDQAGLLDVAVDPDFARTRTIYLSFSEPREGDANGTSVARARLSEDGSRLDDVAVIFRQQPAVVSFGHFGSRLVFAGDGTLFVTLGERQIKPGGAQDLSTDLGKVVRIRPDGTIPSDNPFVGDRGKRPEIWSYGHRNPQGAALNPLTGELWTVEHGAKGGDEVNIPRKGLNYGWPVITYGVDYSGAKIGKGTAREGMEQPIYYWDPSIAPSGMAFVTSDRYPGWKGSLLVGGLAAKHLALLQLDGEKVVSEEALLKDLNARIRDVRQGPDGYVYVLTDAQDGRLLKLLPAGSAD